MSSKRVLKRDKGVDPLRSKAWLRTLCVELGVESHREIQRIVNPASMVASVYGPRVPNSKFKAYDEGTSVPSPKLVVEVEKIVPGSSTVLNHVLWRVLRSCGSIEKNAKGWMYELVPLAPTIGFVLAPDHQIVLQGDHHFLPALERRAGFEALAALTIIFKLNLEGGNTEQAWAVAQSIFRVLLLMGPKLLNLGIAQELFDVYVERIFSQVTFDGNAFDLENYKFEAKAAFLEVLVERLHTQLASARDRRMRSYYGIQVLDGRCFIESGKVFLPKYKSIEAKS